MIEDASVSAPHPDRIDLQAYRPYLLVLARLQVYPRLAAKLDASDLVQQALLRAHQGLGQFRGGPEHVKAWLRQILARTAANAIRHQCQACRDVRLEQALQADVEASSRRLDGWLAADQSSPSEVCQRQEQLHALAQALESLPEDQRAVLVLKHCQGQTIDGIARHLGRTPASVAGLLRRAMQAIRERLGEKDDAHDARRRL
jgi:RNA polymerase sigma-70 factor (ECF subfamily)